MGNNSIKAKIGYLFFAYIENSTTAYDKVLRIKGAKEDHPVLSDINMCFDFLYGTNIKFPCRRCIFDNYQISLKGAEPTDCNVVVSVFEDTGVCEVAINFTVDNTNIDELVYFRQIFTSALPVCGEKSFSDIANDIFVPLGAEASKAQTGYVVEINKWDNYDDPEKLLNENSDKIYGALTGDEGFRFVPTALYKNRMDNNWSSRNFAKAIVYRNNFLLINFNASQTMHNYHDRQHEFGGKYYGGANPYFFVDCKATGVNHGMLFSCETGLIAKTISENVLENKFSTKHGTTEKTRNEIQRTKTLRKDLILILNRLENVIQIAELGELDKLVIEGLEITPIIDKIKYLLELLESELDLLYQTSTNRLVNTLTILGLIIALSQLIVGLI